MNWSGIDDHRLWLRRFFLNDGWERLSPFFLESISGAVLHGPQPHNVSVHEFSPSTDEVFVSNKRSETRSGTVGTEVVKHGTAALEEFYLCMNCGDRTWECDDDIRRPAPDSCVLVDEFDGLVWQCS